jgi:hypothetical protein
LICSGFFDISQTNAPIPYTESILPYATSNEFEKFSEEMYIDKELPKEIIERLQFNK